MPNIFRRARRHNAQGQALVLLALVLTFLMMLILTCMEVAARYKERAQIEDALRQATRSSVQAFDYAAFARNGQLLRESASSITGCASLAVSSARALACTVLLTNLRGVSGVEETPDVTAARVTWTFLPQGGTCSFPNSRPAINFRTPAVCATLQPRMTGLLGWGIWTPQIDAADTLDHIDN